MGPAFEYREYVRTIDRTAFLPPVSYSAASIAAEKCKASEHAAGEADGQQKSSAIFMNITDASHADGSVNDNSHAASNSAESSHEPTAPHVHRHIAEEEGIATLFNLSEPPSIFLFSSWWPAVQRLFVASFCIYGNIYLAKHYAISNVRICLAARWKLSPLPVLQLQLFNISIPLC